MKEIRGGSSGTVYQCEKCKGCGKGKAIIAPPIAPPEEGSADLERLLDEFELAGIMRSLARNAFHRGEKWVWVPAENPYASAPQRRRTDKFLIETDDKARAARKRLTDYVNGLRAEIAHWEGMIGDMRPEEVLDIRNELADRMDEIKNLRAELERLPTDITSVNRVPDMVELSRLRSELELLRSRTLSAEEADRVQWYIDGDPRNYFTCYAYGLLVEKLALLRRIDG